MDVDGKESNRLGGLGMSEREFEKFVKVSRNSLRRRVMDVGISFEDADDLVSGVYARMWRIRDEIDWTAYNYAVNAIRNAICDRVRAHGRRPVTCSVHDCETREGETIFDCVPGSPDKHFDDVRQLLPKGLSERDGAVICLLADGASARDISQKFRLTEGSAKSLIYRARMRAIHLSRCPGVIA